MFTIDQVKEAHAKVKSGADFPAYIKEIKTFGVLHYTTHVNDGHTDYKGEEDHSVSSPGKYASLQINPNVSTEQFIKDLAAHQQGGTNYLQFCELAAANGIDRWVVDLNEMSCTYLDARGNNVLVEQIPG